MDQKEQKESIIKLAKIVKESGELYAECLLAQEKSIENIQKILALETEGDVIQRELDDHFSHQKNIPYLALDRARLVRRLDDILDQIAHAAQTLKIFASHTKPDFTDKIQPLAKLCQDITSELAKAVETIYSSFDEAQIIARSIENLRDTAMEACFQLESEIFVSQDTDWKQYEASKRILSETYVLILNTKNASEVLEVMALKYD